MYVYKYKKHNQINTISILRHRRKHVIQNVTEITTWHKSFARIHFNFCIMDCCWFILYCEKYKLFTTVKKATNKKDTPQLELLLRTVLYQKTSASGHNHRRQNHESINTVRPASTNTNDDSSSTQHSSSASDWLLCR